MKAFYAVLAVVGVAGAAAIAFMSSGGKSTVVTLDPNIAAGTAEGYVIGSPDAKVEIVEYGDFECPACGDFAVITEPDVRTRLVDAGLARFRFVDFPLPMHANALSAHVAAACADEQSKFWPMHDRLFAGQPDWNGLATTNPKKVFDQYAKDLGLDTQAWSSCYDERRPLPRILANQKEGERIGVGSTPTFRIGSQLFATRLPYDAIKKVVDSLIADTATVQGKGSLN